MGRVFLIKSLSLLGLGSLLLFPLNDYLYSLNNSLHLKVLLPSVTTSISNPKSFTLQNYPPSRTPMPMPHLFSLSFFLKRRVIPSFAHHHSFDLCFDTIHPLNLLVVAHKFPLSPSSFSTSPCQL